MRLLHNSNILRSLDARGLILNFPLGALPSGDLANFVVAAEQTMEALGLPVEGLTGDDLSGIREQYGKGADPDDLRRLFGKQ